MTNDKEITRILLSLGTAGVLVASILWLLSQVIAPIQSEQNISKNVLPSPTTGNLSTNDDISLGEEIFITKNSSLEKEDGKLAFAKGDFATAARKFELALANNRNDPESLIYLNNANAQMNQDNLKPLKVAVILPFTNVDQAEEVLRGVAHAQDEVNNSRERINKAPLQLQIVKIQNIRDIEAVNKLNLKLANDSSILAVVGFTLDTSVYNQRGLVMVSPINPNVRKAATKPEYVFYTTPNADVYSDRLAQYIVKETGIKNIALCQDSSFEPAEGRTRESTANINDIIKLYRESITNYGGKITRTNCDFGDPNFQADQILSQARSDGAEGFLLFASPFTINNPNSSMFELVKENKNQPGEFPLFGFQTMYTNRILRYGKENVKDMVLAVPWHRDANLDNPFAEEAARLWGGEVSPRTAMAYDALQAIIAGLEQGQTREELKVALSNRNFAAFGAGGRIKFSPEGVRDREGGVFLVQIDSCQPTTKGCSSDVNLHFQLLRE